MPRIEVDVDPAEVGFDADRLARIDRHYRRYVDDGLLPGWTVVVTRHGRVAHVGHHGHRDVEAGLPVTADTLWRIYSMTKPVTSVAAMMLYEQGELELTDPIARWIPAFRDVRVYRAGPATGPATTPATEPIRVWHLLTHTSGLTYGFHHAHPVDELYRLRGYEYAAPAGTDLAAACETFAGLPLLFEPGTEWNYGVSTDVLGRVVEVVSGQPLDAFFSEHIFGPLGMDETSWSVGEADHGRLATLYAAGRDGLARNRTLGDEALRPPTLLAGGAGLVSTAGDYHRFTQMLLRGGELDGARLLGPRTVAYMTRNHLPGGVDLEAFGRPLFAESAFRGVGFGLGFSTVVDASAGKVLTSPGEYAWGGMASTAFYVDPAEAVTAMFFTQFVPSSAHPVRSRLRTLVQQALVD
ncbi:MAG TPA: serine hydrolase domain-containing protein [Pseudonocardia sp.]